MGTVAVDENGEVTEQFTVKPIALYDNRVIKVAAFNPSTKHYLDKDIFTHIANIPENEGDFSKRQEIEDSLNYVAYEALLGDTIQTEEKKHFVIISQYYVFKAVNLFNLTLLTENTYYNCWIHHRHDNCAKEQHSNCQYLQ